MSPRVTLGLLAILLALGTYVYFGPVQDNPASPAANPGAAAGVPTPKPPDPTLELWAVAEEQIQSVTVTRGSQQAGVERDGEGWKLLPGGGPADRLRVNSLVFRLSTVRATYRVPNPGNDAEFGLNAPSLTAAIGLADGGRIGLTVGTKAVAETGTYARKVGDPAIYLVTNALVQDLERLVTEPPAPPSPTPLAVPAAAVTPSPNP
ncbi:MAG: DUF4340 domain-containing protein [Chloroflexi bacterium]|nr:DUF4340 domain-containing protein [Chloroflexota bacterium]